MYHGRLVAEYNYDAWGNSTIKYYSTDIDEKEAANINPFRYKGYYYDDESSFNGILKIRNKVTTIINDGKPSFFYT